MGGLASQAAFYYQKILQHLKLLSVYFPIQTYTRLGFKIMINNYL